MPSPAADGRRAARAPKPQPPPPRDPAAARRGLIAKIHIARAQLALTDDSYRDLLERIAGERTAGKLPIEKLEAVLAEFRRLGWREAKRARPVSAKAQIRMIYGVWKDLRPHLSDGSDSALRAFCARQTVSPKHPTGVSAPEFLGPHEANKVLEGLKAWLARVRTRARQAQEAGGGEPPAAA